MYATMYGAARDVTGSAYLLETGESRLLVECGMFQGPHHLEKLNYIPKNILVKKLDAVLLTHGHLDHCGRLPLLVKSGYRGPIFATQGTIDIARLILSDAGKIQEADTDRENRKRSNRGLRPVKPLFTYQDVEQVFRCFKPVKYNEWLNIADGIKTQFVEAGHIIGSACIELVIDQNGGRRHLVFSGDLGQWDVPIMRNPAQIDYADIVFMESTYGNRNHRSMTETVQEFEDLIQNAVENKGKILIPSFAVGRTQEILYHLAEMFRKGKVEPFPIYLDSPMAIAATAIYAQHQNLMDEEASLLHRSGQLDKDLSTLTPCVTAEESMALNSIQGPCLILAGAGMCNAGRILHHLRHNLNSSKTIVIMVGYQAKGSLGRLLLEGATSVKIFGETVPVRATIKGLGGFSAHAGQDDLLRWLESMVAKQHPRVVLTHGEYYQMSELARQIKDRFDIECEMPELGDVIAL
jgi:metallo-beta-lactamase family protein